MYEYEYVSVQNDRIMGAEFTGYQEIIRTFAQRGYRLVCCIPTNIIGVLQNFDLVFEREVET